MENTGEAQEPLAFVSYSWDSETHSNWVIQLATRLRSHGVNVALDRWDTRPGSDLSLFMERAGDDTYRVIAIVTSAYARKADAAEGGVGYERKMIAPSLMKNLHGNRVIPVIRDNPEGKLPRFLGTAKYVDFRDDKMYEDRYYELLQELHGLPATPKPPLGNNPFIPQAGDDFPGTSLHDQTRYSMPALEGAVSFDYTNNNGHFIVGTGERKFTLDFSVAAHGSIYIYNTPPNIKTVALAPGVKTPKEVGDASSWDASSRYRIIRVGDAAILRNQNDYWAAVFVDEVHTRESNPTRENLVKFRYFIPAASRATFDT
ncbi:toll/interleukin-1 receptor domain-containing protein [Kocuria sp. M4R2S49]|uniref:toll/interleukin-1 receptor domain-containing protein n=1 Tax=Kocuria rhizosphaericola TaxID=3376284 RepID=UPI00378A2463